MNKKIILSLGVVALLSTAAFASCDRAPMQGAGCPSNQQQSKMMNHTKGNYSHSKNRIISMMMRLDLSDAQRTQIRQIMVENRKNKVSPNEAFSENGFDKEKFIKLSQEHRDNMVKNRADMIEKVYNVLTEAQKKDLKTMLDMKQMMMKNTMMGRAQ